MIFGRNRTVRHEQVSLPAELLEERDLEIAAAPRQPTSVRTTSPPARIPPA